jgi:glyoxylase-like metal-dependent hydrolase (beta-lactamase superfamily II)
LDNPTIIDTMMHGREGITAAFIVRGDDATALVESGPRSSLDHVLTGLERAGIEQLDWILVTHIHLDHAGAAGTLAQRFPEARVAVHPVGAPHLVDPSKLWASASRIYGNDMERLWGGIDPLPEDRIEILEDGDSIDLGGRRLTALETPGHAGHHHAYQDDGTGLVFTGDSLGVSPRGMAAFRPATPPPEFNLEIALASIERIRTSGASSLWLTHFGPSDVGVEEACEKASEVLTTWATWVEEARAVSGELDEVTRMVQERSRSELESRLTEAEADRMEMTTSYRMNVSGYMRYFDKRAQASAG